MKGMTLIVKEVTNLVIGFILLFSIYLVLYGHLSPGGGFVGGVMLSCGLILLILAHGKETFNTLIDDRAMTLWDCIGALLFLVLALLGYSAGIFFANIFSAWGRPFTLVSGGTIPLANIAIGIKVGACLAGAFIALVVTGKAKQSLSGDL